MKTDTFKKRLQYLTNGSTISATVKGMQSQYIVKSFTDNSIKVWGSASDNSEIEFIKTDGIFSNENGQIISIDVLE